MNAVKQIFSWYSASSRAKRGEIFRQYFYINSNTKILDLGSEDGANIARVLEGSAFSPENIFIADIDHEAVKGVSETYGFTPVLLKEGESLPFTEHFFDIVYCSSVLEHVTVPKNEIWDVTSSGEFRRRALDAQRIFANEITRVGRQYFVQTPSRYFPIESHSWLPVVGMLPREMTVPLFRRTNDIWVKATIPDFYLLRGYEIKELFPNAAIVREKSFGLTKSLMAIRTEKQVN